MYATTTILNTSTPPHPNPRVRVTEVVEMQSDLMWRTGRALPHDLVLGNIKCAYVNDRKALAKRTRRRRRRNRGGIIHRTGRSEYTIYVYVYYYPFAIEWDPELEERGSFLHTHIYRTMYAHDMAIDKYRSLFVSDARWWG